MCKVITIYNRTRFNNIQSEPYQIKNHYWSKKYDYKIVLSTSIAAGRYNCQGYDFKNRHKLFSKNKSNLRNRKYI